MIAGPKRILRLVTQNLPEIVVEPDTYNVSPEPVILLAHLSGALALCLHDEGRGVGGLLHLRFTSGDGRPSDVTDNTLSSVLVVLDRFKKAVLGNHVRHDEIQARVLAHALPPTGHAEPTASIVDLIQADFADGKIHCGSQVVRRTEGLCVCFEPFQGRVWISGPNDRRHAAPKKQRA
jgi:chemotaxis receptor (MCP) glutamine deamidase CheD